MTAEATVAVVNQAYRVPVRLAAHECVKRDCRIVFRENCRERFHSNGPTYEPADHRLPSWIVISESGPRMMYSSLASGL